VIDGHHDSTPHVSIDRLRAVTFSLTFSGEGWSEMVTQFTPQTP
jgi:hypothetical protein